MFCPARTHQPALAGRWGFVHDLAMDFRIPDELTALRESFAAFIDREIRPLEEELRPELVSPTQDRDRVREAANQTRRASAAAGFYAAYMPEDVGGADLSTLGLTLLVEDAAR